VDYVVAWGLEHRELGAITAIGVDEIQYAKGHKYLTLVYQIEQGSTRLLWIGKDRTVASFEQFFNLIGKPLADAFGSSARTCGSLICGSSASAAPTPSTFSAASTSSPDE
jgi:hypothetical protein